MTRHHFAAHLIAAVLAFAPAAFAGISITPLPGATQQHAPVGQTFPNPIGVVVRDDSGNPVSGAAVRWIFGGFFSHLVVSPMPAGCFPDAPGNVCDIPTDSSGVARLPSAYGTAAATERVTAGVTVGGAFASTVIELIVDPIVAPARITAASGAGQRTPIGTTFANPLVARVVKADGTPMQSVPVLFSVLYDGPAAHFPIPPGTGNNYAWQAATDIDGYAYAAPLTAEFGMGAGLVQAQAWDPDARAILTANFDFTVTNAQGGDTLSLQDMWWGGPRENGWGVSVTQHGDSLFAILMVYDVEGKPTWRVLPGGHWFKGLGTQYSGSMYAPTGSPFFAYDAKRFSPGQAGAMSLLFNGDPSTASLVVSTNSVTKRLQRFDFSREGGAPTRGVGDLWWGGESQSGWGVSIMEQPGGLFATWFTYDESGNPTWFVMPDGSWTSESTFEGRIYRTTSSPWFGVGYDASKFRATDVGPYRLRFLGGAAAEMQYSVEGRAGTLALERFPF